MLYALLKELYTMPADQFLTAHLTLILTAHLTASGLLFIALGMSWNWQLIFHRVVDDKNHVNNIRFVLFIITAAVIPTYNFYVLIALLLKWLIILFAVLFPNLYARIIEERDFLMILSNH